MRMRKKLNHAQIIQYINNNYRDCDIIKDSGINKRYFYRLKKKWIEEGKIESSEPSQDLSSLGFM